MCCRGWICWKSVGWNSRKYAKGQVDTGSIALRRERHHKNFISFLRIYAAAIAAAAIPAIVMARDSAAGSEVFSSVAVSAMADVAAVLSQLTVAVVPSAADALCPEKSYMRRVSFKVRPHVSFSAIVSYIFRRAAEIVSERFTDLVAVRFTDAVSVVSRMSCCVMERFALHEHRAASVAMANTVLHIAFFMISLSLSSPLFLEF